MLPKTTTKKKSASSSRLSLQSQILWPPTQFWRIWRPPVWSRICSGLDFYSLRAEIFSTFLDSPTSSKSRVGKGSKLSPSPAGRVGKKLNIKKISTFSSYSALVALWPTPNPMFVRANWQHWRPNWLKVAEDGGILWRRRRRRRRRHFQSQTCPD